MEQVTRGRVLKTLDFLPLANFGPLEKAAIHYAAGDKDGGDKKRDDWARGTVVSLGGTIGNMAGPAFGPSGAMLGGCLFDTVKTLATDEPTGYLKDAKDIEHGTDPIASRLEMGKRMLCDGFNGAFSKQELAEHVVSSLLGI